MSATVGDLRRMLDELPGDLDSHAVQLRLELLMAPADGRPTFAIGGLTDLTLVENTVVMSGFSCEFEQGV